VDEVLEHDERALRAVMNAGHPHHRRLRVGRQASRSGDEAFPGCRVPTAQELETHDLLRGLVERAPNLGAVVATMERREPIATSDELAFLVAFGDRTLRRH
jgi:hypothetical protein